MTALDLSRVVHAVEVNCFFRGNKYPKRCLILGRTLKGRKNEETKKEFSPDLIKNKRNEIFYFVHTYANGKVMIVCPSLRTQIIFLSIAQNHKQILMPKITLLGRVLGTSISK